MAKCFFTICLIYFYSTSENIALGIIIIISINIIIFIHLRFIILGEEKRPRNVL